MVVTFFVPINEVQIADMDDNQYRRAVRRDPRFCCRLMLLMLTIASCLTSPLDAADATVTLVGNQVIDNHRALTLDSTIAVFGDMLNGLSYQTPITTAAG